MWTSKSEPLNRVREINMVTLFAGYCVVVYFVMVVMSYIGDISEIDGHDSEPTRIMYAQFWPIPAIGWFLEEFFD